MPSESQLDCVGCKRHQFKCCAFQPFIPNFLCADWPITAPNYHLLPIGLIASQDYQQKYLKNKDGAEMVCVNFDTANGQCRRWIQRPSECTAYHCESKDGGQGLINWQTRAHEWHQLECEVAQMAMLEFGFDHNEIAQQLEWITNPPASHEPSFALKKIWSHYENREYEYYQKCATWAQTTDVRSFVSV